MTLRKHGDHRYGDSHADIREELLRYSHLNGYPADHFTDVACPCSGQVFRLALDDTEGAAVRTCSACNSEHPIGDSDEYLAEATLETCTCPCGGEEFEIAAGISLYEGSSDVKWLYIGCRCPKCGLTAVYGDWKNEFSGYREFLGQI
jgi:hypothetical protein